MMGYSKILALAGLAGAVLLGGCELGHKNTQQTGFRGTGMDQVVDPDHVAKLSAIPAPPYALPDDSGPRASETYKNVKVLGSVSTERFNHLMASINQWVAPPEQGCNYCHNPENMASDEKYTKVVARRMLQMTININGKWSSHVKKTGVTCYTCHRGNAVPQYKWAIAEGTPDPDTITRNKHGQNTPNPTVGYASLPYDPFESYLDGKAQIRVASSSPYPSKDHVVSVKDAEKTYGLMMHMSTALGVNCTYCHNTQSFRAWNLSRPQRATAYYGIRMVRDINADYITPLGSVFPNVATRKGPHGDPYKVNCQTCHQGQNKPLGGYSMLKDNPTLMAPVGTPVAAPEGGAAGKAVPALMADPKAMTAAPAPTATTTPTKK